ncbi:hypothetical protein RJ639_010620 [Escallonia herrerae]|uniref:endo-polygalacturonase n=1 Tax=Escallonia herrerae TaxID=1293975 RepID=A0AA88VPR6_9ASTE|nr:hypothetical protein RJ639_010620 [Escallonia herrerae]
MQMSLQKLMFPLVIMLPFISCCTSLDEDLLLYNNRDYLEKESGHDFQAYPSHFSTVEYSLFDNSVDIEAGIFGLKQLERLAASVKTVSVDSFGAEGDGTSDDTQAFEKAWKEACSSTGAVFVVPKNKNYLVKPIRFTGPCKSALTMQIYGTIEASDDRSDYNGDRRHWLRFDSVQNLVVQGGGVIDGNGKIWWQNSCKVNKALALTFYKCKNLVVRNLKIQNAQQIHVSFEKSVNVQASNLMVTAPEKSPNTDGIHVSNTQNIQISSCVIGTGDDCISIVSGSEKVQATDITCGPGHGISIGSLGSRNSEAYVSDVTVNRANLSGTTNGVRIKTWQGGSGSASNIKFQNIDMHDVSNPIIIDQNYCDQDEPCKQQGSAVQVKNVVYQNIKGTSVSGVAIKFDCSESFPCQGIVLEEINLVRQGGKAAKAVCSNVRLNQMGGVLPRCP